ncbi:MAG: class I SAM-dependent methyltransferase [Deltaproteobacteria bacterium]|nr:class I SAM-dependent methyltransferase [Deltaproteobacteria bacterium]
MKDKGNDIYAGYFTSRGMGFDSYSGYVLPAYLQQILPSERDAAILDIGCGLGQMLQSLRAEGYTDLAGLDVSGEAVSACTAKGLDVSKIDSLADYCRTAGKQFEFIIMSHVIEHVEKAEIIQTLSLIRSRLLKEGGRLVVITPNAQSHTGCYWAYEDFTHSTIFTAGSLYFVLKCAGFKNIEFIDTFGTAGSSFLGRIIKRVLTVVYKANIAFWNRVTSSSFHRPSPQIFTYEIKVIAR